MFKLLILACLITWMTKTTISLMEECFLSSGQLHKLSLTKSTPLPLMCGALDVCCMKYGALDSNHLKQYAILRYMYMKMHHTFYAWKCNKNGIVCWENWYKIHVATTSWMSSFGLQDHDLLLVSPFICAYI